ncbi:MAG: PHP-associated domain-containing protein [Candidatus Woesearchaeota archaeon]
MIKNFEELDKSITKIDMHSHTEYSHDCNTKLKEFGELLSKHKIGVSVTDHNEIKGSLLLKKMFPKLLVVPGIEVTSITSKDVLLYFDKHSELEAFYNRHISPNKKLNRRSNKVTLSTSYILDMASDYNALRAVPHPFMTLKGLAKTIKKDDSLLKNLDAVEVLNATKSKRNNIKSLEWAKKLDMPMIAGSDSHILSSLANALTLTNSNNPSDILEEIRKKQNSIVGDNAKFYSSLKGMGSIFKNKLKKS